MEQGWLSSYDLGLVENHDINSQNGYLAILKASFIRFKDEEDVLVQNQAKLGFYSPKCGYMQLIQENHVMETEWWWNMFRHLKSPLKAKLFCWALFSGKALTWDSLLRRGWEGPA